MRMLGIDDELLAEVSNFKRAHPEAMVYYGEARGYAMARYHDDDLNEYEASFMPVEGEGIVTCTERVVTSDFRYGWTA